jgi:spermidine synthase
MNHPWFRIVLLVLFALSGFAGLIYESIWSHYLKLFLGHAAYAQTLVLAIFMGGMALGSWISSRFSNRWPNLILAYAVVELVIGALGIAFHGIFVRTVDAAFGSLIPAVGSPFLAGMLKWLLGTLLILPQSILLGMTFPLMSAGLLRRFPAAPGATLSLLYFSNSLGAAIGVLVSGFILIDAVGLPGTILTAGILNVLLAIVVWVLLKRQPAEENRDVPASAAVTTPARLAWFRLLLFIALVTGLSSFMYEIGWIRMLSLVLGSSTHSFELMLSAFILGLALGGFWIRRRIDTNETPERFLAWVQLVMGGFALLSLPLYNYSFDVMQWLMQSVQRNTGGYLLFNLTSQTLAMAIMLPATFCAGMTLPLITAALLRRGYGEKSIGLVYAANTTGAIAGVFMSIHLAMPILGLKGLITFGAALDILLGLALLWGLSRTTAGLSRRMALTGTAVGAAAVLATLLLVTIDPYKMASGVYRSGTIVRSEQGRNVIFHRDGKTASVDVITADKPVKTVILTNGKPDASLRLDPALEQTPDEPTMILTAALPMMHAPQARTVAVIGMGSGLTSNVFLANPNLATVDTIEIEPAMIEGAKQFRPRNERVYIDPRSHIHIEDAKSFFSTHNRQYDVIASEPSNPWVSGVANLFSDEFYQHVRRHLRPDGIMVQWLQIYEIDLHLVVSVLKALSRNFPDYVIYTPGYTDILIIARNTGEVGLPDFEKFKKLGLDEELNRIAIRSAQDLWARRVVSRRTLQPLVDTWPVALNSDYFPILDQSAARTRFLNQNSFDLVALTYHPIPVLEMLGEAQFDRDATKTTAAEGMYRVKASARAVGLIDLFRSGHSDTLYSLLHPDVVRKMEYMYLASRNCRVDTSGTWDSALHELAEFVNSPLTRDEAVRFWQTSGLDRCVPQMTNNQAAWYRLYKAVGARNARDMARLARELLSSKGPMTPSRREYLLAAGMAAELNLGNKGPARLLLQEHANNSVGSVPIPMSLKLLASHSLMTDIPRTGVTSRYGDNFR